ncbi:MAG: hypothetical protein FAF05_07285 [Epsilonproteobacteria bacterium]|nr:hypothetical protein [Campylobacterota bacterium]
MLKSTDNTLTRDIIAAQGHMMLSAKEIQDIFIQATITARYLYHNTWYIAKTNSYKDGRIEGQNNVGSYNKGRWSVDTTNNTLSLEWDGYWEDWTAIGYKVNDEFMFFDEDSGKWRITLILVEKGILPI